MVNWFACRVTMGKEYLVRAKIKQAIPDADILVPRIHTRSIVNGIVKDKEERILPGYILVGSDTLINPLSVRNFMQVIGPVTAEEIARLQAQEGPRNEELVVGGRILVTDGPLQGSFGEILEMTSSGAFKCKVIFQSMELVIVLRSDFLAEEK